MSRNQLDLLSSLSEQGICPHCGEDWAYSDFGTHYLLDAHTSDDDAYVTFMACCEQAHAVVEFEGYEALTGRTVVDVVRELTGRDVVDVTTDCDAMMVCRLATVNPTVVADGKAASPKGWQATLFELIDEHHSHHNRPQGWKFGLAVHNGHIRVGVAIVGRPVARMTAKAEPNTLEVTRVCTWGHSALRKNAATKLYASAAKQARQLGADKLITFTLESESAHSLIAAGWTPTRRSEGGSWSREDRPREDKAPTCAKVRWEKGLTKNTRRDVAARAITL